MDEYPLIPSRELHFLLWDWLSADSDVERDTGDAVLELSVQLARDVFLPHYKDADREEPRLDAAGNVHIHPAIGSALGQYAELGLFGASFPERLGGMALPTVLATASLAQFMAANIATTAYVMLTIANARLIAAFCTAAQIDAFARPQIEGRWFGTMCLSEPQAGSSLADINTRADYDSDDALGARYRLRGNKMWISGGDQDATENIVHLVLAKVPDASGLLPRGTAGISLFIVPKFLPGGDRNDLKVAGLNHKMGYRGTANCLLNFGEGNFHPDGREGAVGWLVGSVGQGLPQMFQMMNEARINVGLGAAALAYRGYAHALTYARERVQGRTPGAHAPVPLIEHADVKRMLLAQKAYAEGALALVLYCAMLVDRTPLDPDALGLLSLLTPIAKAWPSEWGLAANDLAIQIHGGYGYTRDFDVEQIYRDNRLNPIHEGTTGIQALDLLGRKLIRGDGLALATLSSRIAVSIAKAKKLRLLARHAGELERAWARIGQTLHVLAAVPGPNILANATPFLQAFGHIVVGWLWLDQALTAAASPPDDYTAGKLRACRFFFECELPKIHAWVQFVASRSDVAAGADPVQF